MSASKNKKLATARKLWCILVYLIIRFLIPTPVISLAGTPLEKGLVGGETPWHISAQTITYNRETDIYTATGDVKITKDDKTLTAQLIRYNQATMEADANGNFLLIAGKDTLKGDQIVINLKTGIGTIYNGSIFIEKSHFYIKGDKILKTGETSYKIENGSVTTCDGDIPPWRITGKEVDITIEEYGTIHNAEFWTKNVPVFYVPYLVFPVNIKRKSGLLPPQMGYSSRNGFEFIQPFFWAINDSSDSTFYFHHIQERGEMFGAESRYALSPLSKGTMMIDSLNDRQVDNGIGDSSQKWGYTNDVYLRKNTDRYWFRMKLDQELPQDFTSKLDIDIVSDQDYLTEFTSGYTGYDATKEYFESEFGRDIDDQNDNVRENSFIINKIWTQYSFNAELLWYDNVIDRRHKDTNPTLQQLPAITFDALKQPVLSNLLFMDMDSGYSNFYRQDGITGQRIDLHPRVYLPMHFENYFTFEPSAGFRQTAWYLNRENTEPAGPDEDDYQHRELYDLRAELSTDLFHVYPVDGTSVQKIKHTLIPRLTYSYIPDLDHTDYPHFDDTDRIDPENLMTFSLTNLLISKSHNPETGDANVPAKINGQTQTLDSYNQFLWFKIEQSYDFIKANEPGEKPFNPLYAELNLTPAELLTLHAETEWDHESGNFTTFNTYLQMKNSRKDHLTVEHRYTRDTSQSISLDFNGGLTDTIRILGNYEKNLEDGKSIESGLGCLYQAQCWSFETFYKIKEDDRQIGFMVTLKGLAEIGSGL